MIYLVIALFIASCGFTLFIVDCALKAVAKQLASLDVSMRTHHVRIYAMSNRLDLMSKRLDIIQGNFSFKG